MPTERPVSTPDTAPGEDGYTRLRCTCRRNTVLASYGIDPAGRIVLKLMWRDRFALIYFGAVALSCRDCTRWTRVRVLPREKKVDITPLGNRPPADTRS